MLYPLVTAANWRDFESALRAFQAGHAGSIPVARSSSLAFFDLLFTCLLFQRSHWPARPPIPVFSLFN